MHFQRRFELYVDIISKYTMNTQCIHRHMQHIVGSKERAKALILHKAYCPEKSQYPSSSCFDCHRTFYLYVSDVSLSIKLQYLLDFFKLNWSIVFLSIRQQRLLAEEHRSYVFIIILPPVAVLQLQVYKNSRIDQYFASF